MTRSGNPFSYATCKAFTSEEVYAHQDFLGQDGDLTDFELELINGGGVVLANPVNPSYPNRLTEFSALRCV